MTLRRCPRCNQSYQAPARYCVNDGSLLVEEGERADVTPSRTPRPRFADLPGAAASGQPTAESPAAALANPLSTLSGQELDRRYRVQQRLGEGGMSYV